MVAGGGFNFTNMFTLSKFSSGGGGRWASGFVDFGFSEITFPSSKISWGIIATRGLGSSDFRFDLGSLLGSLLRVSLFLLTVLVVVHGGGLTGFVDWRFLLFLPASELKNSNNEVKFSLFLLGLVGGAGVSRFMFLRSTSVAGIFLFLGWEGGGFLLVDLASPWCFRRIIFWPIFTNSCWLWFGWGFFLVWWVGLSGWRGVGGCNFWPNLHELFVLGGFSCFSLGGLLLKNS